MAVIGRTQGGRNITINGAPFDNAAMIFPYDNNKIVTLTGDLTGSITAQPQGNSDTPQTDWANGFHDTRSGNKHGQGNIPLIAGSDGDKELFTIYNATHPDSNSGSEGPAIANAYHKFLFVLYLWHSDETDANGNPTKYTKAAGSILTSMPPENMSNGTSNNQQPDTWPYSCAELTRHMGQPANLPKL